MGDHTAFFGVIFCSGTEKTLSTCQRLAPRPHCPFKIKQMRIRTVTFSCRLARCSFFLALHIIRFGVGGATCTGKHHWASLRLSPFSVGYYCSAPFFVFVFVFFVLFSVFGAVISHQALTHPPRSPHPPSRTLGIRCINWYCNMCICACTSACIPYWYNTGTRVPVFIIAMQYYII